MYPCNKTRNAPVQGCKTPWRQVARVTNFHAVAPNISGFTLCKFCMSSIGRLEFQVAPRCSVTFVHLFPSASNVNSSLFELNRAYLFI